MYGGFFWFFPAAALVLWSGRVKEMLRERKLWLFGVLAFALAFVVAAADIEMAGILQRYWSDFGLLLVLPAVLTAFGLEEKTKGDSACGKLFYDAVFGLAVWTIGINGLWLLVV